MTTTIGPDGISVNRRLNSVKQLNELIEELTILRPLLASRTSDAVNVKNMSPQEKASWIAEHGLQAWKEIAA